MFLSRLKGLRKLKGITQAELSHALNVSQGTVGNWESGTREPDFFMLAKIADYFNCSTDYLLGRVDYPELVIKKAPPESGADVGNYAVNKGAPEFTAEEILRLKEFLQNQDNSSGE